MTTTSAKNKNTVYYFWTVVSLLLMFGFRLVVPPFAGINEMGITVLGTFFGVLIATMTTGQVFWPSLLGLFSLVWGQFDTGAGILATWFGNSAIQQIIWVMALAGAVADSGVFNLMVPKLLRFKFLNGHPIRLLLALFLTILIFTALFITPTLMIVLIFPIIDSIAEMCGIKKDSDLKRVMLLGSYIAAMGSYALPFRGIHLSSIAIISGIMNENGLQFDNGAYLLTTMTILTLMLIIYVIFIKFVWNVDLTPLKEFKFEKMDLKEEELKLNKRQKILLGFMVVSITYLLAGLFITNPETPLFNYYQRIGNVWIWIAAFAVLCILRTKDGTPFINGTKILQSKTMWGIITVAGLFTICGRAIASDAYGIKPAIMGVLAPVLGSNSWPILVILSVVISAVFTNITNGMPVSFTINAIAFPIACQMQNAGMVNATVLAAASILGAMCAFLTNGSIAYAPLLLGREEITSKFIWTKGVVTLGIFIVVACIICIAFGFMLA
jgi:sodium-dependent dicarboxylate transporter 2/3/5